MNATDSSTEPTKGDVVFTTTCRDPVTGEMRTTKVSYHCKDPTRFNKHRTAYKNTIENLAKAQSTGASSSA